MSDALLIAAHGSRDEAGVEEFRAFAQALRALRPDRLQAEGYLEFASPTIGEAANELVEAGARKIVVVPAMLTTAGHVKNDVPSELTEARTRHPGVTFLMARAIDLHAAILELCKVRFEEVIADRVPVPRDRTLLLLVGRGTNDPDANSNIAKIARLLWEGLGLGHATIAFTGVARPGVEEALGIALRMGFERIVVQPYLLFDGVLLKRLRETVQQTRQDGVEIIAAEHLRSHPLLLRAFEDRAHEALHGSPGMTCDMCKYRVKIIGREPDLAAAQEGRHHHVRAILSQTDERDHDHRRRIRLPRPEIALVETFGDGAHPWDERLLQRLKLGERE